MSICFTRQCCALVVLMMLALGSAPPLSAQDPFGGDPFGPADPFADPFGGDPFGAAPPVGGDPFGGPPVAVEKKPPDVAAAAKPHQRHPVGDMQVDAALSKRVTLGYVETPLGDVLAHLSDLTKANFDAQERALNDVGIALDTPITFSIKNMRLESALRHMLTQLDLVCEPRGGRLVVTTPEEAESQLITRVYAVKRLLRSLDPLTDEEVWTADDLLDLIQSSIQPTTWDQVGGPGSIAEFRGALVVSQTYDVHRQLHPFLATLEEALPLAQGNKPPPLKWLPQLKGDEAEIENALGKEVDLAAIETPLQDIVDFLAEKAGIPILLDGRALDDVGIGSDTPVTRRIKGVTLGALLRLVLKEMDLSFRIRDDALLITTPEEYESGLQTRIYPVGDLVYLNSDDGFLTADRDADYDTLIDLIMSTVRPTAWDEVGGPGQIEPYRGCLVFSQTDDVFKEIDALLAGLRHVAATIRKQPDRAITTPFSMDEMFNPRTAKMREILRKDVGMIAFRKTPLVDIADLIANKTDAKVQIDARALEDIGLGTDSPVTATLGGETLGQALRRILRPMDLTWVLRDEVVLITTPEEAESALITKLYPVRDLLTDGEDDVDQGQLNFDSLIDVITATMNADSWEDVGGPGSMEALSHPVIVLVVSQTEQTHENIGTLLTKLRNLQRAQRARDAAKPKDPPKPAGDNAKPAAAGEVLENKQGQRLYMKVYKLTAVYKLEGESAPAKRSQELSEIVGQLVEPQSWQADPTHYLRPLPGSIIIRHTAAAHRKIHRLLTELDALEQPWGGGGGGFGTSQGFGNKGGGGISAGVF